MSRIRKNGIHMKIRINTFLVLFVSAVLLLGVVPTSMSKTDTGDDSGLGALDRGVFQLTAQAIPYYYYPGDTYGIYGQLTEDGIGVFGNVCLNVTDPNGDFLFGGLCINTNATGFYAYIDPYSLPPWAILGIYHVNVAKSDDHSVNAHTSFDVVSPDVIADADGPYEAQLGQPITFHGSVTGGKPPHHWLWEFGDGNTSEFQNTTYTYHSTGLHTVSLTVTDDQSHSGIDTTTAIIYGPNYGYYLYVLTDKTSYYPGETITISGRLTDNGTGVPSYPVGINITKPDGQIVISDTKQTNAEGYFSLFYFLGPQTVLGAYTVNANVSINSNELQTSTSFTVLKRVIVADAGGPYEGEINQTIQFSGDASGGISPYNWTWRFGDGKTGYGQYPTHTYNATGTYTVNLTAKDSYDNIGYDTTTVTISATSAFNHTVLLEYATATTCVPCVTASRQLYEVYATHHYDFFYVTLVSDKNDKSMQRFQQLGVPPLAVPDVFFDGGFLHILAKQETTTPYIQAIQTCHNRTVVNLEMSVDVTWRGNATLGIDVSINNYGPRTYHGTLRIYITEPTSRWNNNAGEPYHFGALDYIEESVSVVSKKVVQKSWDGNLKGFSDILPNNIRIIAAVYNESTDHVDETASSTPGSGFAIQITQPIVGLYIKNKEIRSYKIRKTPVIIGPIDIQIKAVELQTHLTKVEYYVDNVLKYTTQTRPFDWTWDQKTLRTHHTLKVIAYGTGGKTTSDEITVWKFF